MQIEEVIKSIESKIDVFKSKLREINSKLDDSLEQEIDDLEREKESILLNLAQLETNLAEANIKKAELQYFRSQDTRKTKTEILMVLLTLINLFVIGYSTWIQRDANHLLAEANQIVTQNLALTKIESLYSHSEIVREFENVTRVCDPLLNEQERESVERSKNQVQGISAKIEEIIKRSDKLEEKIKKHRH